jgi:hypothetical protein
MFFEPDQLRKSLIGLSGHMWSYIFWSANFGFSDNVNVALPGVGENVQPVYWRNLFIYQLCDGRVSGPNQISAHRDWVTDFRATRRAHDVTVISTEDETETKLSRSRRESYKNLYTGLSKGLQLSSSVH